MLPKNTFIRRIPQEGAEIRESSGAETGKCATNLALGEHPGFYRMARTDTRDYGELPDIDYRDEYGERPTGALGLWD